MLAEIEARPRTRTEMPLPGLPAFWITWTPGALPWSAPSTLAIGWPTRSAPATDETELLSSARSCVPYPTATTSSSLATPGTSTKSTVASVPSATVTSRSAGA